MELALNVSMWYKAIYHTHPPTNIYIYIYTYYLIISTNTHTYRNTYIHIHPPPPPHTHTHTKNPTQTHTELKKQILVHKTDLPVQKIFDVRDALSGLRPLQQVCGYRRKLSLNQHFGIQRNVMRTGVKFASSSVSHVLMDPLGVKMWDV